MHRCIYGRSLFSISSDGVLMCFSRVVASLNICQSVFSKALYSCIQTCNFEPSRGKKKKKHIKFTRLLNKPNMETVRLTKQQTKKYCYFFLTLGMVNDRPQIFFMNNYFLLRKEFLLPYCYFYAHIID